MCEVVGGGVVAGQEFQGCVGGEQVLQGLQGEGDCVCVCLNNLVLVTSLILRLSCNEGSKGLKVLSPSIVGELAWK